MQSPPPNTAEGNFQTDNTVPNPEAGSSIPSQRQKPRYPRKNHPKWDVFWISMIIIMAVSEYIFLTYLTIPLSHYLSLAQIALVCLIVFFIGSTLMVTDGISFSKNAICYMGATKGRRSGSSNKNALILLIFFVVFFSMNTFILIHFITAYYPSVDMLIVSRVLLFISVIVIVMMALVPINIHEMKHGYMSLLGFIVTEMGSAFTVAYFIRERINVPWIYVVFSIEMLLALGYIGGFLIRFRYAPLFQKTCILFTAIAFYLYLTYFISIT